MRDEVPERMRAVAGAAGVGRYEAAPQVHRELPLEELRAALGVARDVPGQADGETGGEGHDQVGAKDVAQAHPRQQIESGREARQEDAEDALGESREAAFRRSQRESGAARSERW